MALLTPEQVDAIDRIVEHHVGRVRSTDRADRAEVEQAMKVCYEHVGYEWHGNVIWVDSPIVAVTAGPLADAVLGYGAAQAPEPSRYRPRTKDFDRRMDRPLIQLLEHVAVPNASLYPLVERVAEVGNSYTHAVTRAAHSAMSGHTTSRQSETRELQRALGAAVRSRDGCSLARSMWTSMGLTDAAIGPGTATARKGVSTVAANAIRPAVGDAVRRTQTPLDPSPGAEPLPPHLVSTMTAAAAVIVEHIAKFDRRTAAERAVAGPSPEPDGFAAMMELLDTPNLAVAISAWSYDLYDEWKRHIGGAFDSWVTAIDAVFNDVYRGVYSDAISDWSRTWGIANSAGWWWPHPDFVVVSDRPVHIVDGELHNPTGPVIEWADGWKIYALNGVVVPSWVVTDPDPSRFLSLELANTEQRRVAFANYGWGRAAKELDLKVIDSHPDPTMGVLYELPSLMQISELSATLLVVDNASPDRDGTVRQYGLLAPGSASTVVEAQAALAGLSVNEFLSLDGAS